MQTQSTHASVKDYKKGSWIRKIETSLSKPKSFIDHFYKPFVNKMQYNISLNENLSFIRKKTCKDAKDIFYLGKKNREVGKISNDLIIYNNPSKYLWFLNFSKAINLNTLSKETYNKFISYTMKTQHDQKSRPNSRVVIKNSSVAKSNKGKLTVLFL